MTIKFNILNRFSGNIRFTAEIDCAESEPTGIKLGLAVRCAVKASADLARADLARADLAGAYLAGANLTDANLTDANLAGADLAGANLARANLAGADLAGADLAGAYLAGANLAGADLAGADLAGAYLAGAYLARADLARAYLTGQWCVQGPTRSDGYAFMLTNFKDEGVRVKAGCRNFSLAEARRHWTETRKGTPLGDETFAILDCLEALAKIRGYDVSK